MKSIRLFFLLFVSAGLRAGDNLRIPDMRSLGMGGNGVTQSLSFNPALVAKSVDKVIYAGYFNRYGMKELGTAQIGFACPNTGLSTGIDMASFGYDRYRESLFRLSAGKRLGRRWWMGVGFQCAILQTELFEEVPKRLSTDIGILFAPVDRLLIGLLIMDFPSFSIRKETVDLNDFGGYRLQVGFQWEVINSLLIAGTFESNKTRTLTGDFGMEYAPFRRFHIRAGIEATPLSPSLGVGCRLAGFSIDMAALYHPVLGISTGIGLRFSF